MKGTRPNSCETAVGGVPAENTATAGTLRDAGPTLVPIATQFVQRLNPVFQEHTFLLRLIAVYFVSVAIFVLATGEWTRWVIRWSYPSFAFLFVIGSLVRLLASPGSRRFETVAGAALVGVLAAPIQSTFNSVKQIIGHHYGYPWDARFAEADRWLHFGQHPWEWFAPLIAHPGVVRFIDLAYMMWFPVLFAFVLWAAWTKDRALRRRALVSALLLWVMCGNVAAILLASAGPCYYDAVAAGSNPYEQLMMVLDSHHRRDFLFARFNQMGLWNATQSNTWLPFGGISAMPSVHVAMAVLIALIARARNATAGMLLTVFALLTMLGSVVLGWHYAIDGYVGALMAYVIWRGVSAVCSPTVSADS
jgi:PAP2 superfamily